MIKKLKKDTNNKILAIVYSDKNKFLLLRTNPKTMKVDHWYVVTGGVKEGESFEKAALREIKEETKLKVIELISTSTSWDYEWPQNSGVIKHEKAFLAKVMHANPKLSHFEHLDWKWLNKEEFLKDIYWYGESKDNLKKLIEQL